MGRFPWDPHRNGIPMDNPGISYTVVLSSEYLLFVPIIPIKNYRAKNHQESIHSENIAKHV